MSLVDRPGISGGGAERFARALALGLNPERFERILCFSRWETPSEAKGPAREALAELEDAGVRVLALGRPTQLAVWKWRPLLSLLRNESVEILHAHKFGSNVWGAVLGTLARTPVVIAHEQTWSFEGRPLRRFLDRRLIARRADAFIAVSREDRRRMIELEGIPPERVRLLPNAITTPAVATGRDIRTELGIDPDQPLIGTVAVLRPQKALEVLVRAVAILRSQFPRIRVLIAGSGPERRRLDDLIETLGLDGTVLMLGSRHDVPDINAALDVAVLSSDFEGTPLAIMEYMEAGRPIVATRVGGVPELIDDGVHGRLVPPQDPEALASCIAELLTDPARAREMGRRAQARRRREFDVRVAVRSIEHLYEELFDAWTRR